MPQSSGGINIQGIQVGGSKDKAEVNITMYLVDSETGQVKASNKVVGTSARKGGRLGYFGGGLGGVTGGLVALGLYFGSNDGKLYAFRDDGPEANFSASPLSGQAPLLVSFTDLSTGIIDTWLWNFGDGSTSTEQNPIHTYT